MFPHYSPLLASASALFASLAAVVDPSASRASAFILQPLPSSPPARDHHYTIHHSSVDDVDSTEQSSNDDNNCITEHICQKLQNLQETLLTNPSQLQPILQQHQAQHSPLDSSSNIHLSSQHLIRETLLSTRLTNLPLNRTRIAESTIEGAGRGLFATEDIGKGELITMYPGDALLCEYSELEEEEEDLDMEELDFEEEEYYENDADYIEEVVLWGDHVDVSDRLEEDVVFDGSMEEDLPPLTSYAASVDDVYSVMGMPILDSDPSYSGHLANDGAGHIAIQTGVEDAARIGIEEIISTYVEESVELSNAIHKPLVGGLHLGTFATKDIREGEEIMVTYGPDYWMAFEG